MADLSRGEFVRIDGYTDFMAGLKDAPRKIELAARRSIRASATKVVTRAAVYAPRKSGNLASNTTIRIGQKRVTIDWNEPYSGVQEFGTVYMRADRGVQGPAPRGTKKTYRQKGHVGAGFHEVHMVNVPPPPRFAFRARDELADQIGQDLIDAVEQVLLDTGYWEAA
jgi:hypothetical protein